MGIDKLSLSKQQKKKRTTTIFGRLTNKFLQPSQHSTKRDQSVQTSLNLSQTSSQLTATVLVNSRSRQRTCSPSDSLRHSNSSISTPHQSRRHRRRSSLKTFIISHSPKPIPLIQRTRRRSVDLKTPKRLSSECLQVALIRKIQPVNRFGSPMAHSSNIISVTRQKPYFASPNSTSAYQHSWNYLPHPTRSYHSSMKDQQQQLFHDETNSRDDLFSIGPMKWSTPNRTLVYKTSSPYNNHNNHNFDQHRRLCTVDQLSFSNLLDGSH